MQVLDFTVNRTARRPAGNSASDAPPRWRVRVDDGQRLRFAAPIGNTEQARAGRRRESMCRRLTRRRHGSPAHRRSAAILRSYHRTAGDRYLLQCRSDEEAERVAVGREERGRRAFGASDRRALRLVQLTDAQRPTAERAVHEACAVRRDCERRAAEPQSRDGASRVIDARTGACDSCGGERGYITHPEDCDDGQCEQRQSTRDARSNWRSTSAAPSAHRRSPAARHPYREDAGAILLETAPQQALDWRCSARRQRSEVRLVLESALGRPGRRDLERPAAREHLVEHAAEGPDVATLVDGLPRAAPDSCMPPSRANPAGRGCIIHRPGANASASPKSSTLTVPSGRSLIFAGFRSRWIMRCSCAASSASAICRAIGSASSSGRGPCAMRSASVGPSTSSSTSAFCQRSPPNRRSLRCADD